MGLVTRIICKIGNGKNKEVFPQATPDGAVCRQPDEKIVCAFSYEIIGLSLARQRKWPITVFHVSQSRNCLTESKPLRDKIRQEINKKT
jgi:hypothetical protein